MVVKKLKCDKIIDFDKALIEVLSEQRIRKYLRRDIGRQDIITHIYVFEQYHSTTRSDLSVTIVYVEDRGKNLSYVDIIAAGANVKDLMYMEPYSTGIRSRYHYFGNYYYYPTYLNGTNGNDLYIANIIAEHLVNYGFIVVLSMKKIR
ncbi:MAG: hypothetical protein K6E20_07280 [Acholeplasmatales bacterium]|nr:hypothetical protein [Acholeplasmatales bacterium]